MENEIENEMENEIGKIKEQVKDELEKVTEQIAEKPTGQRVDVGKIGIGTKENIALKPALVKIISYDIAMQKNKKDKEIGEKVAITCKHPDKPETIEISSVAYKRGKEIKTSGLWFNLDEDNLLNKQSALASFLANFGFENIDQLVGKEIQTELDEKNYLCFKAY